MKRTWVYDGNGKAHEVTAQPVRELHQIMPDIEGFAANGKWISSRRDWREHLERTGTVEMGHADIKAQQEKWSRRQRDNAEKVAKQDKHVKPVDAPVMDAPDYQMTRLNQEVRNRLEGRPVPNLKTLIKLTLEEARGQYRRR